MTQTQITKMRRGELFHRFARTSQPNRRQVPNKRNNSRTIFNRGYLSSHQIISTGTSRPSVSTSNLRHLRLLRHNRFQRTRFRLGIFKVTRATSRFQRRTMRHQQHGASTRPNLFTRTSTTNIITSLNRLLRRHTQVLVGGPSNLNRLRQPPTFRWLRTRFIFRLLSLPARQQLHGIRLFDNANRIGDTNRCLGVARIARFRRASEC